MSTVGIYTAVYSIPAIGYNRAMSVTEPQCTSTSISPKFYDCFWLHYLKKLLIDEKIFSAFYYEAIPVHGEISTPALRFN